MIFNNEYYTTISNILAMTDKIKAIGSFKLHKDFTKVCDIDLNEMLPPNDFSEIFKSYISRLKKQFVEESIYLIKAYFNIPYPPLKNISRKLGYIDGTMILHNNESILDDVNNLPTELKNNINMLISKYRKTKDINDYLNIMAYINTKLYANWSLDELLEGTKKYYDTIITIKDELHNINYFYIEVIYKKFRVSNYINISETPKNYYMSAYSYDIILDSKLSYYRLLKKFKVFIKWLSYTYKIKDHDIRNKTMILYNEIAELIEKVSVKYNKYCIIKNKIDIINIKIKKYTKKKNQKKIIKYNNLLTRYNKKYSKGISKIEKEYKQQYLDYIQDSMYTKYMKQYFKII